MGANGRNRTRSYFNFNFDSSIKDIANHYEKDSRCIDNNNVCADLLSGLATKLRDHARNPRTGAYGR